MSLAFVNQQPFVTSNIIGATSLEQLKENIASIDIELNANMLAEIEVSFGRTKLDGTGRNHGHTHGRMDRQTWKSK